MKKHLLRKILLNVVLGGALLLPNFWATGAEAAEISGNMSADDITEPSTVIDSLYLQSGVLNYTLTNNSRVYFEGATTMNAAVNGGGISFYDNIIVTDADYINGEDNWISDCTVTLQGGTLTKKVGGIGNLDFAGDMTVNANNITNTGTNTVESGKTIKFINRGTIIQTWKGAGNLDFAGDMTVNANNITNTGTNTVASDKTVSFTGGTLTAKMEGAGNLDFAGDVSTDANNIANTGTNTVASGKTLTFTGGLLQCQISGAGNLNFAGNVSTNADNIAITGTNIVVSGAKLTFYGGTLTKKVQGAGNLDFVTDMIVNADNIANTGTNTVESGKTIKFNSGTITQTWNGAGNLHFACHLTFNADNIATTGTNTVESGAKLTFDGGTLTKRVHGEGNLDFATDMTVNADNIANTGTNTVESGKKITFNGGTITQTWNGTGTTEFNNTVSVADGVNLGTATNNVNGTLDLAGHITAGNINFKNGSTLKVDGTKITDTPAITGITSATVESGAKLYVSNAVGGTPYKILAGSGISVNGWQTDAEMGDGFYAAYGLLVDNIINNGNEFTIQFKEAPSITIDIPNILQNILTGSKLQKFIDDISLVQPDRAIQATVINTMSNLNSLANVQQSTYTVSNMAADSIHHNIDVFQRPILVGHKGQGIEHRAEGIGNREDGIGHRAEGLRNVFANDKDTAEIKTVEQGESGNIMPAKATTEHQTYNKEVWANYIHSKRTIDGMKTGKFLEQDSTSQYNGITTGIDLWNSRHGFGGIALTTVDGEINSNQTAGSIKNETDYKGISVYNRYDTKNTAILTDFTYTHSDHDIKMRTAGTEDITAKPKVDAYSIGIRAEQPIAVSKTSEIAPYAGVRYTKISTKDYKTSLDLQYDIDSPKIFNIPIGIAWRNQNQIENGWKIGEVIETGYMWNIGDRDSTQHLSYGGINDNIG
ncbi:MAG: autotransporter domain-containing protein, partial [Phascolarctobacterium sp.]|nr:autotransporter domain-containing protein [Candidatus Phascolarctobacterium caballi]